MSAPTQPKGFLTVRVHDMGITPSLTGLCVGYERGEWRSAQFVDHIMEWLPEFTLSHSETSDFHAGNSVQRIRHAARRVYETKKFKKRGEFGELFLHMAVRQVFGSLPAISKLYYKSAGNDTVKGFDAVHVIEGPNGLELWLGEAKFYTNVKAAIREVVKELALHTTTNYLRGEFLLLKGKVDPKWPHAHAFEDLINERKSLDDVFARAAIPVLLTYNSQCLAGSTKCDAAYIAEFDREVREAYKSFASSTLPADIAIHLILLPLKAKKDLIASLDQKLKAWQAL